MDKRESRPGKDGSKQEPDSTLLYRSQEDEARNPFHHFKTLGRHRRVLDVILYGRTSTWEQYVNGNLQDQIDSLRAYAARCHVRVRVLAVCTDKKKPGGKIRRAGLMKAFNLARKTGAVVLAESVDRFIRPKRWNPKDKSTWTRPNYEDFERVAHGVTCATVKLPSASDGQQRSAHIKRGQRCKRSKGGRPRKLVYLSPTQRRLRLMPEIRRLRAEPMGYCKIAGTLKANWPLPCKPSLSSTTVMHWLQKYGE